VVDLGDGEETLVRRVGREDKGRYHEKARGGNGRGTRWNCTKCLHMAFSFAAKAIELNPTYAKAYYRRGLSYLAILRPTDAVPDFKKALHIEPGNKSIREQLQMTVKLIRRIEFEKVGHPSHWTLCRY